MLMTLRIIRGLCGLLFCSGIVNFFSMKEMMLAKLFAIVMFGLLFLGLRALVNYIHLNKYGQPHPSLAKNMWAL
jgi:hypothetical protein